MNTPQEWQLKLSDYDAKFVDWGRNRVMNPRINSGSIFYDNLPINMQKGLLYTTGDKVGQVDMDKVENLFLGKCQEVINSIIRSRRVLQSLSFNVLTDYARKYLRWAVLQVIDYSLGNVYSENNTGANMSMGDLSISDNLTNWIFSNQQWGTAGSASLMLSHVHDDYVYNEDTKLWEYKGHIIPIVDQNIGVQFKTGEITYNTDIDNDANPKSLLTNAEIKKLVETQTSPTELQNAINKAINDLDLDSKLQIDSTALDNLDGGGS